MQPESPGPRNEVPLAVRARGLSADAWRAPRSLFLRTAYLGKGKGGGGRGEKEKEGRSEERGREARILGNQVSPQQAAGAAAFPLLCIPQEDHALGY